MVVYLQKKSMYSKNIDYFLSQDIKLLRSLNDIIYEYSGEYINQEYLDESNIESERICQINRTLNNYMVGFFNERGSGKCFYTINEKNKFVENVDFVFV